MCGIVGFTNPATGAESLLRQMMTCIRYRGPDEEGIYLDNEIACGHLRLTIVAPDGGQQPRANRQTGDVLIFNGEIYGYLDHADWLRSEGVSLKDESDTEVLYQMIRHIGIDAALDRLDGMFAFAYRDGRSGALYLVRDRFGEKPLFYAQRSGALIFASEIKSLLQHPALHGVDFDYEAIEEYLFLDYVPAPKTGLSRVEKLRPGEILKFVNGDVKKNTYWIPPLPSTGTSSTAIGDIDTLADQLTILLDQSIEARLIADVPVGVFLSGGIDSALIAARASRFEPNITAYTIRFNDEGYDETPYAVEVAEKFCLRHEVCDVGKQDVIAAIDSIESQMDEPYADNSIVPTYLLCETAGRDVTVALGGDGGDELFAGYINFQAQKISPVLAAMPKILQGVPRTIGRNLSTNDNYMSFGFKFDQLLNGWGEPAKYQSMQWMSAFSEKDLVGLLNRPAEKNALKNVIDRELDFSNPTDAQEQLQYLFCRLYLANDILTKVDRASMYHSMEVRSPFLARPLAEFALSLPGPIKIHGRESKRILRQLGRRWLPESVSSRAKHGFALPVAGLIRGHLAEPISDTLLDKSNPIAHYFSQKSIATLLSEHISRRRDHRKRIWSLYCLFLFARNIRNLQSATQQHNV